MKIVVHTPAPQPEPPKTYDLLGLTEGEVRAIRAALGAMPPSALLARGVSFVDRRMTISALRDTGVTYQYQGVIH